MGIFKDKVVLTALIIVIVTVGGAFFFLPKNKSKTPQTTPAEKSVEENVKQLKAKDIGLSLTPRADRKGIIMKITKLSGISSIEYEVSYDAEVTDEGKKSTVPRGVVGSPIEVKSTDADIKRDIDLGTCSRNICKYDKVVSDVKFVIKINYSNGEVGSVEEKVSLSS